MASRSRMVKTRTGLALHVREWLPESAPASADDPAQPIILVHGFLDSGQTFSRLVESWLERSPDLAASAHIVAPDMRGHGDSDRVGAGGYYHFFDYLADLDELVASLGHDRISLIGHSMGANICSYYAGAFAERVQRLVLLEGLVVPEGQLDMPGRVRTWLASWQRARDKGERSYPSVAAAAARMRKHDPLLSEAVASELAARLTREHAPGDVRFKHDPAHLSMGPYPFRLDMAESLWRAVRAPVLYVRGSESRLPVSDAELERRLGLFERVDVRVLQGAGHALHWHDPDQLAALFDQFFAAP